MRSGGLTAGHGTDWDWHKTEARLQGGQKSPVERQHNKRKEG